MTKKNEFYRKVVYTTRDQQLVLMSLRSEEEIGSEEHPYHTQFLKVEQGSGYATVNKSITILKPGTCVIVPRGAQHNVWAAANNFLKIYVIYSPPMHPPETEQLNKPYRNMDE